MQLDIKYSARNSDYSCYAERQLSIEVLGFYFPLSLLASCVDVTIALLTEMCFQLSLGLHSCLKYPTLREMIEQEEFVTFQESCKEVKHPATQEIEKMEAQLLLIADAWSYISQQRGGVDIKKSPKCKTA